jgi:ferredoxin
VVEVEFLEFSKQQPSVKVVAQSGDALISVAEKAGVVIDLGCNQGNCGVCEVSLTGVLLEQRAPAIGPTILIPFGLHPCT